MGLSSVFSTAITGLQANETTIDVVGNNIANANTVAFKASEAIFSTQFLQTLSLGSAPTGNNGGRNPRQVGLGVQVAAITPDFTPGTLEISSTPSDLAIEGDGFFIVQSTSGEQLYTRNGKFQVNSENQLTTINGERLLGFGVDDDFQIESTTLVPLEVPLGSAAVAKATENVYLEGTLTPTGDIATTAEIIQTGAMGDASQSEPAGSTTVQLSEVPDVAAATLTGGAGGALTPAGTYRYRVVFADGPLTPPPAGTESTASANIGPITLGPGEDQITLNNLPVSTSGDYSTRRIYRTVDGGSTYQLLTEIPNNTATTFVDGVADGALGATLDTNALSGNYSYYVTYANAVGGPGFGVESRPAPVIGPLNVVNGRVQLDDLPVDTTGQWGVRRIYRNLATDDSEFRFLAEIPNNLPNQSFTDSVADAGITGNAEIDLDGPRISTNTLLTNVLRRDDNVYENVFELGTLSFQPRKGDRALTPKEFEITATTTVLDLVNFMEDAMGIQEIPGQDPINPIPQDITGQNPGGSVTANGEIRFVGNNGVDNALEIGLSGLTLVDAGGTEQVNLAFGSIQSAVGESAVADFVVYDSLGIPMNVRVTTVLESISGTDTTYRWFADSGNNDPLLGSDISVGTGLIRFDGEGKLIESTGNTVSIDRRHVPSASPMEFDLDFSKLSGLADASSTLAATRQDGFPPGKLTSYIVGEDGVIRGVFDNGTERSLGQLRLASFANSRGLEQRGQNLFGSAPNSGLPVMGNPGEQGIGSVVSGAVELSNTDIGENLIDLILASTAYRGNTRVITTAQQMLDELLNLRR